MNKDSARGGFMSMCIHTHLQIHTQIDVLVQLEEIIILNNNSLRACG